MTRTCRQPAHTLDSHTQKSRSRLPSFGRFTGSLVRGELPVAVAEERDEAKQVENSVVIVGTRLSPDQSHEINRLVAGRDFREGTS
jgi:hypothetical protein